MRKLSVFMQVTLDGYYATVDGDLGWAHRHDPEFQQFVTENAQGGGELVFGRATYDMMVSYWPTEMARQNDPVVSERMNQMPKVVFSRHMPSASWHNTRLLGGDLATEMRKLKAEPGKPLVILGSGSIVTQLATAGLIDEFQLVVNPLFLGRGKKLLEGATQKVELRLTSSRTFANGCAFLCYAPA